MCTLLTVSSSQWNKALESHIRSDARSNPDGFACLLTDMDGAHTLVRSMNIEVILTVLRNSDWERMFLHTRYATTGETRLDNTHGWESNGAVYFHNGKLQSRDADGLAVDSQAIGLWLSRHGLPETIERLQQEPFANVFIVDLDTGIYTVFRSATGSLYTDGSGSYSTKPFGDINRSAPLNQAESWYFSDAVEEVEDEPYRPWETTDVLPVTLGSFDYSMSKDERDILLDWHREYGEDYFDANGIGDYTPASIRRKANG